MPQGAKDAGEGIGEQIKGSVKKVMGGLTGNESQEAEGRAQEDKADAKRDAAAKEAEAEKARAQASAHEADQRSHQ